MIFLRWFLSSELRSIVTLDGATEPQSSCPSLSRRPNQSWRQELVEDAGSKSSFAVDIFFFGGTVVVCLHFVILSLWFLVVGVQRPAQKNPISRGMFPSGQHRNLAAMWHWHALTSCAQTLQAVQTCSSGIGRQLGPKNPRNARCEVCSSENVGWQALSPWGCAYVTARKDRQHAACTIWGNTVADEGCRVLFDAWLQIF